MADFGNTLTGLLALGAGLAFAQSSGELVSGGLLALFGIVYAAKTLAAK